ncbi:MAG: hypothetical protein RL207_1562, partial [Bacteroidota bacterium]
MNTIFHKLTIAKIHLITLLFLGVFASTNTLAQCGFQATCPNTDYLNFGMGSNTDAASIEYDNFISSFHTTIVRTAQGSYKVWGETSANNGTTELLSPTLLNSANYPALTGTILKAHLGSNSVDGIGTGVQGIVLTTTGLFAWGSEGVVIHNNLTTSTTFQKLTIGGNSQGLPAGVTPLDVKMLFVTEMTIALTTCSGNVYVLTQISANAGKGLTGNISAANATQWHLVTLSTAGNPTLSNVIAVRGSRETLFALTSSGTLYTWGDETYLGNNSALTSRNRATLMSLPTANPIKMIGVTRDNTNSKSTYYVLNANGNLYALGGNNEKQIGDWSATERLSWVQPRYNSATGPVMSNIHWISPNEHDSNYAAINVLTSDSTNYNWGDANGEMLGRGNTNGNNPGIPNGISASDKILAVETGGHTSMLIKKCQDYFGYVGHRIRGSMGDGTNNSTNESTYTFATAVVYICGATNVDVSISGTPVLSTTGDYCNGTTIDITATPSGGTYSLTGSATLTGNNLTFTGSGNNTVNLVYTYNVPGCPNSVSANLALSVGNCAIADAGPASAAVCSGSTYTTAGNSINGTITWTTAGTGTFTNGTTNTATYTPSAADITAGTVTLTVTVVGTSTMSDNIVLNFTTPPSAGTLSGTQSICVGSTTTFASTVSGGAWTSSNAAVATVNSSGVISGIGAGTATITYTITGTGGCANATATRTVTVTAAPSAGTLSGTQNICNGSSTPFLVENSSANSSALDFDGVNDFATAPAGVYFDDNTFTIESWVYINSHNNYQRLFDFGNGITNNNVLFVLSEATNGKPGFNIYNASGQGHFINSPTPLPLNQWVHLAAVRNGTFAGIYVNGSLVVSANDWTVSTPNATRNNCYIGKDNWGSSVTMGAKVREFRIWTTAKTQLQIQTNMNASLSPQADLRLLYRFNQGISNQPNTATTILDQSGANYFNGGPANATMSNFALTGSTSNWTNGQTTAVTGTWSSSNTAVATVNTAGAVTGVTAGTSLINYTITGTGGCANVSATSTVTVTAAPSAGTLSGTTAICTNGSSTLSSTVSGGTWASATPGVATINPSTGVVTGVTAGTSIMTYTVTGSGGCADATATITITVNALPLAATVTSPQIACPGNTVANLQATVGSGITLQWFSASTGGTPLASTTSLIEGTTYYAQATNSAGCSSTRTPLVVVFNNALDFDGVDDYVNVGDIIENLSDVTVEAWVYWEGSSLAHSEIFAKDGISSMAITSANKLHANFGNGSIWIAGLDSQNPIPLNKWTHVAVTRQSGTVKMFINGVEDAATTTNNATGQNSSPRIIGGKMVGSSVSNTLFNGKIDELRFWNIARTTAQISSNTTTQFLGNETNLLAYYNFNQGIQNGNNTAVTTLTNSVNSANNGTITNFTLNGTTSNFVSGYFPEISGNTSVLAGSTIQLAHATSGGTWSSSNTSIATINSSGVVTGVAAGTVTMTYSNCAQSATYSITVISNASLTINSSSISNFASCLGTASAAQTFTVSGSNLTSNVTVTAPTGYEVSLSSGSGYASSISITASGTLNATTVYLRLANTASSGSVSGTLNVTSSGASTQTISLTGTVTTPPSAGTLSGTTAICSNGSTTLSSTVTGGAWTSATPAVATINPS